VREVAISLIRDFPTDFRSANCDAVSVNETETHMTIFYSEQRSEPVGPLPPYETWDAVKGYLNHYSNYLVLDFMAKTSKDGREKAQARKELTICERKLAYWRRHPNFRLDEVTRGVEKLKAMWR
jgi:hypothetical protein